MHARKYRPCVSSCCTGEIKLRQPPAGFTLGSFVSAAYFSRYGKIAWHVWTGRRARETRVKSGENLCTAVCVYTYTGVYMYGGWSGCLSLGKKYETRCREIAICWRKGRRWDLFGDGNAFFLLWGALACGTIDVSAILLPQNCNLCRCNFYVARVFGVLNEYWHFALVMPVEPVWTFISATRNSDSMYDTLICKLWNLTFRFMNIKVIVILSDKVCL